MTAKAASIIYRAYRPHLLKCKLSSFLSLKDLWREKSDADLSAAAKSIAEFTGDAEMDSTLATNLKIHLCRGYTGDELKTIDKHFRISEVAVSMPANEQGKKSSWTGS